MILREESMMVPMKEHSILSAGKLIHSVGMSCVLTRWSWGKCPFAIFRANPFVISWLILKR